jgi:hypothetical protein
MIATPTTTMTQMARLVHPFDVERFLQDYYEQRPLYIARESETHFADLLTADDIDEALRYRAISPTVIRMVKDGKEVSSDRLVERDGEAPLPRISNDLLFQHFIDGCTLIINTGNRIFPRLEHFCEALEREIGFRTQPNIYVTPFTAQGFDTHYDEHDVFVMQVMGMKKWRLFNSPISLPSRRQPFGQMKSSFAIGEPEMEVTLKPGDLLYIPRGFLHDAVTDGTTSAHITLGFYPVCQYHLVHELGLMAEDLPAFRRSIRPGAVNTPESREAFGRLLRDFMDGLDIDELMVRVQGGFLTRRRSDLHHRFRDLASLNRLTLDTVVRRRTGVVFAVDRGGPAVTVRFLRESVPVQPFLESALEPILGDREFAVRDIDGFLTDAARIDLVRTFVRTGLLQVIEWNGAP